jgi:tetratricopeptide (TPR) repeat protein
MNARKAVAGPSLGRVLRCALLASVGLASAEARADGPPSRWDAARDPDAAQAHALHVEVQRRLAMRDRFDVGESQALSAKAKLERAGAEASRDPRLRFDLGLVYFVLQDYDRAAKALASALAFAPEHPAAEEAWLRLAFACGHTGDHGCERRAYVEVLRLVTEEPQRATPTLNLAETEMHLGNLREAIDGYQEALRLAARTSSRDTAPLAVWGLAVALDRSADQVAAEKNARFALELERSSGVRGLLRSTTVFFVPSYEIHWYEGLGASAEARVEPDATKAASLWRAAEQSFEAYVRAADRAEARFGEKDRWLELARARLAAIKVDRARAEKRRAREPARSREREDEDVPL